MIALDLTSPVVVRADALAGRPDVAHYRGQVGTASRHFINPLSDHVMVYWPRLGCSSQWRIKSLRNAIGTEAM